MLKGYRYGPICRKGFKNNIKWEKKQIKIATCPRYV